MVFQGIMSRNWLSELRKCAANGTFHPYRRVKREGSKAGWRGSKIYILEHILHYSQELEKEEREREGERMTF